MSGYTGAHRPNLRANLGRTRLLRGGCSTLAVIAALAASDVAHAQAASAARPEATVETLVVTAQKRSEVLLDVPAAVSAFSGEQLASAGIATTKELSQVTPGFAYMQSTAIPQAEIRGVGSRAVNPGDESNVPIYIDGIYQPFSPGGFFELPSVDRVEVLKGPQGTLFGRNATGGAINIVTRAPSFHPTGSLILGYGRFDQFYARGYLSGGLSDKVAADISFVHNQDGGYVRVANTGGRTAREPYDAVRAKLLVRATDNLDFTLSYGHSEGNWTTGLALQPYNGNTLALALPAYRDLVVLPSGPFEVRQAFPPKYFVRQDAVGFTANMEFSAFTLTSLTGLQKNSYHALTDLGLGFPIIVYDYHADSRSFTEELRLVSKGQGPLKWLGGVEAYVDRSRANPISLSGISNSKVFSTVDTQAYAVYVEATYDFTPELTGRLGGRYTYETKDLETRSSVAAPFELSLDDNAFTPSVTLEYKPQANSTIYGKYTRAFKDPSFNSNQATAANAAAVGAEQVDGFELGFKTAPMSDVLVSLTPYYSKYKNIQVQVRNAQGVAVLQNAASAEIYGVEAELIARISNNLDLRAGASYLHGRYDKFPNAVVNVPTGVGGNRVVTVDATGKSIEKAPVWSLSLGGEYRHPLSYGELAISSNLYWTGEYYWDPINRLGQSPYALLSARLAWRSPGDRYEVAVWGKNLLDEVYERANTESAFGDFMVYGQPRTLGLEVSSRF